MAFSDHADFKVFVDFDSTLYHTAQFTAKLWQAMAEAADLSVTQVRADTGKYSTNPRLGDYDFQAHIDDYGLDSKTMWQKLDEIVAGTDCLYADSASFIRQLRADGFCPQILSFGESRFQAAKIKPNLSKLTGPDTRPLEFQVIMQLKTRHIAGKHPGQRGVLIDDKPDQNLPAGFTEIHLHRDANLKQPQYDGQRYTVSTLDQARQVILQLV